MWKFQGDINGTVDSPAQSLPMVIQNYRLVNVSGGSISVNVYMITEFGNYAIAPSPQTLSAGQMYSDDNKLLLNTGDQIRLTTTGSINYLFNIENA